MNKSWNPTIVTGGIAAVALASLLLGSWYTVDETERGVLLRNGALVGAVEPGLSFKIPFF